MATTMRGDASPIILDSCKQAPIVVHFVILGVDFAFPGGPERAEMHRRRCCYLACWADSRILCDTRRPLAGRLLRLRANIYTVYT